MIDALETLAVAASKIAKAQRLVREERIERGDPLLRKQFCARCSHHKDAHIPSDRFLGNCVACNWAGAPCVKEDFEEPK